MQYLPNTYPQYEKFPVTPINRMILTVVFPDNPNNPEDRL